MLLILRMLIRVADMEDADMMYSKFLYSEQFLSSELYSGSAKQLAFTWKKFGKARLLT